MADVLDVYRSETLPIAADFGALLGTGEATTLPTAVVWDIANDVAVPAALSGVASIVNTDQVQQGILCSAFVVGYFYAVRLTATLGVGKIETVVKVLRCVG